MNKEILSEKDSNNIKESIYKWMDNHNCITIREFCKMLNINTSVYYRNIGSKNTSRRITMNRVVKYIIGVVEGKHEPKI
nr:MAG TPA: putative dihydroxyacetone kinase regulator [Caudoviricetes sp.]